MVYNSQLMFYFIGCKSASVKSKIKYCASDSYRVNKKNNFGSINGLKISIRGKLNPAYANHGLNSEFYDFNMYVIREGQVMWQKGKALDEVHCREDGE